MPGLKNKVTKAYLLADPEQKPLAVNTTDKGVSVEVPENAPSPIASVVVLEIEGQPDIVQQPMMTQAADGTISLPASEADIHGNAQYEKNENRDNIGYWSDKNAWVSWDFILKTPGRFEVEVTFACPEDDAGSEYTVAVGKEKVSGKVAGTGDWGDFVSRKIGTINLSKPGQLTLSVRPITMPGGAVMNLKSVKLLPIKSEE